MDTQSKPHDQRSAHEGRRTLLRIFAVSLGLAAVAYVLAIMAGLVPETNRPDGAAMTALAFALLISIMIWKPKFMAKYQLVEAAGVKFEVRDIKARQIKQEEQLALLLPLVLPKTERKHLHNLDGGYTTGYAGNPWLQTELRRLRSIGLIASLPGRSIGDLGEGTFDLSEYVILTPLGRQWLERIKELKIEEPE